MGILHVLVERGNSGQQATYDLVAVDLLGQVVASRRLVVERPVWRSAVAVDLVCFYALGQLQIFSQGQVQSVQLPEELRPNGRLRISPSGVIHYWSAEILYRFDERGRLLDALAVPEGGVEWVDVGFTRSGRGMVYRRRDGSCVLRLQEGASEWEVEVSCWAPRVMDPGGIVYEFTHTKVRAIDPRAPLETRVGDWKPFGGTLLPDFRHQLLDPLGGFIFADSYSIARVAPDGRLRWWVGDDGSQDELDSPNALTVDPAGRIFVEDADGVVVYTSAGYRLGRWSGWDVPGQLTPIRGGEFIGRRRFPGSSLTIYNVAGDPLRSVPLPDFAVGLGGAIRVVRDQVMLIQGNFGAVVRFGISGGEATSWRAMGRYDDYLGCAIDRSGALVVLVDALRTQLELRRFDLDGTLLETVVLPDTDLKLYRETLDGRLILGHEHSGGNELIVLESVGGPEERIELPEEIEAITDVTIGPLGDVYVLDGDREEVFRLR